MPKFHDEFFRRSTPSHDELVALTLDNIEQVVKMVCEKKGIESSFIRSHVETEKICKARNGFIIGYIDVLGKFTFALWDEENINLNLVIDAKPELKSWGGPLRQIKTYMDVLRTDLFYTGGEIYGVFTTFSTISDRHRKILENEKVYVVTFSGDGLVSGPVQSRLGEGS